MPRPHVYRQQQKKNAVIKAKLDKLQEVDDKVAEIYKRVLGN